MRQPLLLEAILSNTRKDHPGYASMHTALEKASCAPGEDLPPPPLTRVAPSVLGLPPGKNTAHFVHVWQIKLVVAQIDSAKEMHEQRMI